MCAPPLPLNSSGTAVFSLFLLVSTLFSCFSLHLNNLITSFHSLPSPTINTPFQAIACIRPSVLPFCLLHTIEPLFLLASPPKDPVTHPSSQAQLQPTQPNNQPDNPTSTRPFSEAMTNVKKHIVIIGAGISGLAAGKALSFLLLVTTYDKMTTSRSIFPPSSLVSSILVSLFSLQRKVQAWPPHGGV